MRPTKLMLMTNEERQAYRHPGKKGYVAVLLMAESPEPNQLVLIGSRRGVRDTLKIINETASGIIWEMDQVAP